MKSTKTPVNKLLQKAFDLVGVRSLDEWERFMNGYRDPLTKAARKQMEDEEEDFNFPGMSSGGGGGEASERECGSRNEGGTYAVCPTSKNGKPIEYFMVCQPVRIDKEEYGLQNIGVRLRDILEKCDLCKGEGGYDVIVEPGKPDETEFINCPECDGKGKIIVTHVFDIIGQDNYPNVADFLEETKRLGVSRRLELENKNQYARLSSKSRLILLHERAVIDNALEIYEAMGDVEKSRLLRANCPKNKDIHAMLPLNPENPGQGCASLFWNVLEGGEEMGEFQKPTDNLEPCILCKGEKCSDCKDTGFSLKQKPTSFVKRQLVSGAYRGYRLPETIKPKYSLGIFGVFPLAQIHVVNGSGEFDDRVDRASAAKLDVLEVDC